MSGGRRKGASGGAKARSRRIRILTGCAVLALGALGVRAAFLGTVQAGALSARAEDQRRVEAEIPARRGDIVARDGRDLAAGVPALFVTADPGQVKDPIATARALAPLLGRNPEELANQLGRRSRYEVLARAADSSGDAKKKLAALKVPGLVVTDVDQRFYPQGKTAAQLLGLIGEGGNEGLEEQYDDVLTGRPGRRVELQDPFRRPLRVLVDDAPVDGRDVHVTIDSAIQEYAENVAVNTRERSDAASVSVVVMRPSDGAIYAMATVPRYDPNNRAKLPADRRNLPAVHNYEPGSTFKIVTIAGALEEGLVTPKTAFVLPPTLTMFKGTPYATTLHEAHDRGTVTYSVSEILKYSSNIGTVKVAERLSEINKFELWIRRFGFGAPTGIDYPGESPGDVPPGTEWSGVSILNIPIGQGITTTLLQMARAYAAVANGGRLVTPHLATRVGSRSVPAPAGKRIISSRTARQLTEMLVGVVRSDGTGAEAQVKGYDVAGKTGTSNKIAPDGTYDRGRYWASFIGYLPARNPKVLIAVMVDEPSGGRVYGGEVAAPAFEDIAKFTIGRLAISP
ncbi:MAG: penicillin-binding protein 2 [Actinomycetota bacterium]